MIERLLNTNQALINVGIHVGLGILSATNAMFIVGWFFYILLTELFPLINQQDKLNIKLNYLIVYLSSLEIVARMSRATPLIPYEMSKYVLMVLFIYGILNKFNKGDIGWLLLALILPGIFYDQSGEVSFENIVFNSFGDIDLALGVIYFSKQVISKQQFTNMVKLALFPSISVLSFAFIRTPKYDTIDFGLSANFDTSGGFGSNQVSTALGLGIFFIFVLWITGKVITGIRLLDIGLIIAFVFQGFLTFSRGGMTGSGLAILTILFIVTLNGLNPNIKQPFSIPKLGIYIIPLVIIGVLVFQTVDEITGNNLSLRYQGETAGTVAGSKEVDINTLTSNRYSIFMDDIDIWSENFMFGVGVGASAYIRPSADEVATAAHVEFSRLLADHGLLGLIFFITILLLPFQIYKNNKDAFYRAILIGCFVLGLYTTFHSAMRTYATPLLIGISMISVRNQVIPTKKSLKVKKQFAISF